ncbi:MAG TPA: MarR family transcriptional regulator [Thermomicrobiales bacterium]|nr:MarR family transcriptional regulator [Thermomicrobiales bacterium]
MLTKPAETRAAPATDDMIDRLQTVLPKYHHLLKSILADIQGDDRLTLPQLRSLRAIAASDGGMLTSILARHLRSAPPTVTRIVDGLVERGLVERQADPDDRRRWRLVILPPGDDLLATYETRLHTILADRLASIPPGRQAALWLALDDLDLLLSDASDDPDDLHAIG